MLYVDNTDSVFRLNAAKRSEYIASNCMLALLHLVVVPSTSLETPSIKLKGCLSNFTDSSQRYPFMSNVSREILKMRASYFLNLICVFTLRIVTD